MYEELIRKLKDFPVDPEWSVWEPFICKEAADAIESLQAENAMLKKMQPVNLSGDAAESFVLAIELSETKAQLAQMAKERDAAISKIEAAYEIAWECDIPSPDVPEYVELHNGMTRIMEALRGSVKGYKR